MPDLEKGIQPLMYTCGNRATEKCNPEISKWKSMEKLRENEGVVLSPPKEEVDEICRNCEAKKEEEEEKKG